MTDARLEELGNKLTYLCMAEHEGKKFEFQDLYDIEELITAEQQRRIPTEEVQRAIDVLQAPDKYYCVDGLFYTMSEDGKKAIDLAITALRQMIPQESKFERLLKECKDDAKRFEYHGQDEIDEGWKGSE